MTSLFFVDPQTPKPYNGIHPLKATSKSITQEPIVKPKQRVHIPHVNRGVKLGSFS
jgi:hypothetical protein